MADEGARARRARLLRALFGMLYRSRTLYWLASTIPFAGQWRRWQRLVLPHLTGHDVLEVGCGTGTLLADMQAAGYACQAVDRSPQMVAAARRELLRRGFAASADGVREGDVRRLPCADVSFDCVVSTFPTEYIYDPAALREIARVLRPGGRLIVVLGAMLLPEKISVVPLVAFQSLVYGTLPRRAGACVPAAMGASFPPLAAANLRARSECVRGPFWEAYLVLGEKPAE